MDRWDDEERRLQVRRFLRDCKEWIGQGFFYFKGTHQKNLLFLSELGWVQANLMDRILSLEVENYSQGPLEDTFHPGDVYWVFGKRMEEHEFYIKLKICTPPQGGEFALCISFHHAEYPMEYPFQA